MELSKLLVLILSIAAVENQSIYGSTHEDKCRSTSTEEPERLICPTSWKKVVSRFLESMNQCKMKLNEFEKENNEKITNMAIALLDNLRTEMNEKVKSHNREMKLLKETFQEQIESLKEKVEAGDAKQGVRLVNGNSPREGRVEVYIDGVWGTVCGNYHWDLNDANVVCKQLFGLVGIPYRNAYFGRGTGLILMDRVSCNGTESSLLQCKHRNYLSSYCGHWNDAGVVCMKAPPVRLSNQKGFQGRVEVYKNNRWGTICDTNWDNKDASVICRSLGYSEQGLVVSRTTGGTGPIHLDDVQCSGEETGLYDCTYSETHNCSHTEDAGVICLLPSRLIRLRKGKSANEGFIEISVNGQWGAVCNTAWDVQNAKVACRSLGYSGGMPISSSVFGKGNAQIWLDGINCRGHEDSLLECTQSIVGSSTCNASTNAAVVCYNTGNDVVRMVNGSSAHEGRVQVLINGQWRSVCRKSWDTNYAGVTCRSLGYSRGLPVSSSLFGKGNGQVWLNDIDCYGHEDSLLLCSRSVIESSNCINGREVEVICYNTGNSRVRIVNGSSPDEGLVEILVNDRWRGVCNKWWSKNDADVTCGSLGYSGGIPMSLPTFGKVKQETWFLDRVNCYGNEDFLLECSVSRSTSCNYVGQAGVICYHTVNGVARIINGSSPDEGGVEVLVNDQWQSVCYNGWGKNDADVACRSLGFLGGIPMSLKTSGEGKQETWFLDSVSCNGNEDSLLECQVSRSSRCHNREVAGVICYNNVNNITRIVNGSSQDEGLVKVLVNGQWRGICNYRWDKSDSDVTCRSLGYSGGFPVSSLMFVEDKKDTWMLDGISCVGREESLLKCPQSAIRFNNCNEGKAGVVCYHTINETMRYVNEISEQEKSVIVPKIYINGTWRMLCKDRWDDANAGVICRSAGYSGYQAVLRNGSSFEETLVNDIRCNGGERMLAECKFGVMSHGDCTNGGVEVECYTGDFKRFIRLVNGTRSNKGRVEVFVNGRWGTVCDDGWSYSDASVVCRSIGYSRGYAYTNAYFGRGSGPIWLDDVRCQGTESSIFDCRHRGYGNLRSCNHSEDAGVRCE